MTNSAQEFINIRKEIIRRDFRKMNDRQFEAMTTVNGPVLILAGAGSGKTTVLVNRIAYMVKYGDAYCSQLTPKLSYELMNLANDALQSSDDIPDIFSVDPIRPWEILAITFTNKAAGELKDRIAGMLKNQAEYIKAGTFHSVCSRILRRDGERLGYDRHYTIYDTDDQKRVMKEVMKKLNISEKMIGVRAILSEISHAKDRLISPKEFSEGVGSDLRMKTIARAYKKYNEELHSSNAMDFDDLIVNTVRLFSEFPDVLERYQSQIKYIMVDEYQDTNHAQYMLVKLLAGKFGNICVVGDDDQSIYRFRGATIENILSFESQYPNAKVIRLEQNYRSTQNILDAANAVIAHNEARKGKSLWTDNGSGDLIKVVTSEDENDEARFVTETILESVKSGGRFSDCAVLYRINAQSNQIENVFARSGIPYKVVGGFRFFERKEIRDVLAYLQVVNNPNDSVRLRRIINEPKRGVGTASLGAADDISEGLGIPLFEVFRHADRYPALSRVQKKLLSFCEMIEELRRDAEVLSLHDLLQNVLDKSGYKTALTLLPPEEQDRLQNVEELATSVLQYEQENEEATLSGFLEEISLVSDLDSYDDNEDSVVLMTLHSAKGLEFGTVFLVGMEEGIFPGSQTIYGGPEEMEEERRLAYVGITRAKRRLYITNTSRRMLYGKTTYNLPSRFVDEIPKFLCDISSRDEHRFSSGYSYNRSDKSGGTFNFDGSYSASSDNRSPYAAYVASKTKPQKKAADSVKFSVGDRVSHGTFGEGTVTKAIPMGNDTLMEIFFDKVGQKKLMATFAKLKKI